MGFSFPRPSTFHSVLGGTAPSAYYYCKFSHYDLDLSFAFVLHVLASRLYGVTFKNTTPTTRS
jgi:hypothetical protein